MEWNGMEWNGMEGNGIIFKLTPTEQFKTIQYRTTFVTRYGGFQLKSFYVDKTIISKILYIYSP
jgi:hypothetical protein